MTEYQPTEIDADGMVCALTFSADNEYLVSAGKSRGQVWRVRDGELVATLETGLDEVYVVCITVSQDGRWIAAGTYSVGAVVVWDAMTYERLWKYKLDSTSINAVDFSPDATRLVVGSRDNLTATIYDVASRKPLRILGHEKHVLAAKYSSQGDRIATADEGGCIRVWDANDGRLLVNIPVNAIPYHNTGLNWLDNHLFAVAERKIKELDASTGEEVWEWPVHATSGYSCIAVPKHGGCIAYAFKPTVTFWDTVTHTQLCEFAHPHDIRSITISWDDQFIAVGGNDGRIVLAKIPSCTIDSIPLSRLHPTLQEPNIQIDGGAYHSWQHDHLENAEALLTTAIAASQNRNHHALACRALVQARLRKWDTALADAEMAIDIRPSVLGYIAKSMAHIGAGEEHEAYRSCDIASERFHSSHITFLLLIRAIIVFMAGKHVYAISRMDDLIATVQHNSIFYVIQAYMHLLIGNSRMESGSHNDAIQSFEHARVRLQPHSSQTLSVVSLISGWKFGDLDITIQQRMCEAFFSAGRIKDAGDSLLNLVRTFEGVYAREGIVKWVSDFTRRYLSTPASDTAPNAMEDSDAGTLPTESISLLKEWAKTTITTRPWRDALAMAAAASFIVPRFASYRAVCGYLEETDRITEATECFFEMISELGKVRASTYTTEWVCDFTQRRLSVPVYDGGQVSNATTTDATSTPLLREWAKAILTRRTWEDAVLSAANFTPSKAVIYRVVCEHLETIDRVTDAVRCFHRLTSEFGAEIELHDEHREWASAFRQRYSGRPEHREEHLGDEAMDACRYGEAVSFYTTALSLDAFSPQRILVKRSKAYFAVGLWKQALDDANQAIALDPSSPWGYKRKHAALHETRDYKNAVNAFEVMLSKIEQSSDLEVQRLGDQYINPSSTRATIRKLVLKTTRRLPGELINTKDGRLYNRVDHASAFESLPIFNELVSSMTTRINYGRIKQEVRQYFRYVMLSHKWEENEPLFQQMTNISVYDLEASATHDKLQMFCKITRDAGFVWAWSDTCCINKSDHFILQEALVAMFKWYEGSALTVVYLRGVHSLAQLGALMKSIWNTRAWTLQEYIAAKIVHFYTEDWSPYLGLRLSNHKESPEVISEMEEATGVSAKELMALRPGLNSIREKLRLASTRKTTYPEDAAYSLLGIFSVTGIPAIYGEGGGALGRLLANILTRSGDVGVLAWAGEPGPFNSCLPAHINVFSGPASSHLPQQLPDTEMETTIAASRTPSSDLGAALRLYDRICELPTPRFAESRLTLPCIAIRLSRLSPYRTNLSRVYRTETDAFGTVDIRTKEDLSRLGTLYLVHPWLGTLLDHEDMYTGAFETDAVVPPHSPNMRYDEISDEEFDDERISNEAIESGGLDDLSFLPEPVSPSPSTHRAPMDRETRAIRFVARLRQPFGALLFRLKMVDGRVVGYKRVAAESLIRVQFQESFSLGDILDRMRTFDVL